MTPTPRPPIFSSLALAIVGLAPIAAADADAPRELRVRVLTDATRALERVELVVEGVPPAENPFDPDLIAVDAEVSGPSAATSGANAARVPGFWHVDFDRRLEGGREALTPRGEGGWRIRCVPLEAGAHTVRVTARVEGKVAAAGTVEFRAAAGDGRGFVRVEPLRKRYFRLDDGTPLFLNGLCVCWHDARGSFDYDDWLPAYEKAGINYIRLWMWHVAFGIEWDRGDRNRYRMGPAWVLDRVLSEAERRGIRVLLCFDYHGILETKPDYWKSNNEWPRHPYNAENGGPAKTQNEFFTSPEARALYEKRLRYIVGRWSAFPNILAWQFFNEIDNVYRYLKHEDVVAWHRDMARTLRGMDPYRHLITTSLTGKSERPDFWKLPEMDLSQYHSYNEVHPARVNARIAREFHEKYGKPAFVGEYGTDFRGWKPETDPYLRALHQAIWSGALSGCAGTSMSWWWQDLHRASRYGSWSSLSGFLGGTAIARAECRPAEVEATGGEQVEAYALSAGAEALLWILDPRHSWPDGAMDETPAVTSGARIAVKGMEDGTYAVAWWDPVGGKPAGKAEARAAGGALALEVPDFRMDIACRAVREAGGKGEGGGKSGGAGGGGAGGGER